MQKEISAEDPVNNLNDGRFQIFEKVLVQNIQFGLSPSLTGDHLDHPHHPPHHPPPHHHHHADALRSVPRWRFVVAAFPHVMQCAASMLQYRWHYYGNYVNDAEDNYEESDKDNFKESDKDNFEDNYEDSDDEDTLFCTLAILIIMTYLIFVIFSPHAQFFVNFFLDTKARKSRQTNLRQKCINCDKTNLATKKHEFHTCGGLLLITHLPDVEKFQISPHLSNSLI